jgi:hypothetical protein
MFLEQMDHLNLFPRTDGIKPFLLLDGHGSRLELPFLEYINDPLHEWLVCIGKPFLLLDGHGTSYWQVGDSAEQNGSYKMALTTAKKELVLKKQRACLYNPRIETYEITLFVQSAWDNSFARVEYNHKAITARGWCPLTRNLLDHPEILASEEQAPREDNSGQESLTIGGTLNFSNGLAHSCITDIIQNIDLENVREQIRTSQEEGRQALATLTEAKWLSAGVLFKSGQTWLGPEVVQVQLEKKNAKDDKERKINEKRYMQKSERKGRPTKKHGVRYLT